MDDAKFGDRAAGSLRNGMGSWRFIFGSLSFILGWIGAVKTLQAPFDNPQLTILNLILSCVAALQGGILLISARYQDTLLTKVIEHISSNSDEDLRTDQDTNAMVKRILEIVDVESREPAE